MYHISADSVVDFAAKRTSLVLVATVPFANVPFATVPFDNVPFDNVAVSVGTMRPTAIRLASAIGGVMH